MTVYLETTVVCLVQNTKTCAQLIAEQPRMCYHEDNRQLCCASCADIRNSENSGITFQSVFYWVPLTDVNETVLNLFLTKVVESGAQYIRVLTMVTVIINLSKTQPTTHVLELTECHNSEISYKFIRCKNHIPITFGILEILDISRQLGNPCNFTCSCINCKFSQTENLEY